MEISTLMDEFSVAQPIASLAARQILRAEKYGLSRFNPVP